MRVRLHPSSLSLILIVADWARYPGRAWISINAQALLFLTGSLCSENICLLNTVCSESNFFEPCLDYPAFHPMSTPGYPNQASASQQKRAAAGHLRLRSAPPRASFVNPARASAPHMQLTAVRKL